MDSRIWAGGISRWNQDDGCGSRLPRCVAMRLPSSVLVYSPLTRLPTGRRSPRAGKTVMDMYVACSGAARASPLTCAHRLIEEQGKEMSDMLTRVCAAGLRGVGLLVHASGFRRSISDYSRSSTKHSTLPP